MHTRKRKAEAQAGSSSHGPLTKRQRGKARSCRTDEAGAACRTLPTPLPSPSSTQKKTRGRPRRVSPENDRTVALPSSPVSSFSADTLSVTASPSPPPKTRGERRTTRKSGSRRLKEEVESSSDASSEEEGDAPSVRSFQTPLSSNREGTALKDDSDSSSCSSLSSSDDEDLPLFPRQTASGINIESWRSTLGDGMEGQKRPMKAQDQLCVAPEEESADALLERIATEELAEHVAFVARLVKNVKELVDVKEEQLQKEEERRLHEEDAAHRPQSKKCLIAFKEAYHQVEVAFQEWKLLETLQDFEDRQVALPTTRQRASSLASSTLSPEDATPPPLTPPRASPIVEACPVSPVRETLEEVEETVASTTAQKEEKLPRGRPPKVAEKKRRKMTPPEPEPIVVPQVPRFIGCGGLLSEWRKEIGGIYSLATPLHRAAQASDTTEEETATGCLDTMLADPDLAFLFSPADVVSPAKEIMKQYDMQVIDVDAGEREEIDAELAYLQNHPFGSPQQEEEDGEENDMMEAMRPKKPKMALVKEDVSSPTGMDYDGSAFLDAFFGAHHPANKVFHAEEEVRKLSSHDVAHLQELLDQALDLARLTSDVLQDPCPPHRSAALLDHVDELGQREQVLERLLGVVV